MRTAATPSTASRSFLRSSSVHCRIVESPRSPETPIRKMASEAGSKRSSRGRSASSGSRTLSSFSRTSSPAKSMLVSQTNSRVTSEAPARDREVTRRRPGTTEAASSMGRVTSVSTSMGAAPGIRVSTVRVG